MANGDFVSAVIGADGWYADLTFVGLSTGGTYSFGLGTNNDPATGTPKVAFTVVSLGFDDTGAATTVTRTVYGTKQVRKAYPNQATNEESTGGGNVTVRVALSDYIYAKDATGAGNSGTAPTVTLLSGVYTQGGTPTAATTNSAVTNSSTKAYPKVVGNWSFPGHNKLGASFKLHAVAFHHHGQSQRPVRCVKFTATDAHSHTNTVTVTTPGVDTALADALPVVEYYATMDGSGFTQNDAVTCDFIAYPWVGDAAACLDTTAGTAQPTPLYGTKPGVADPGGTYAQSVAVVDSASGNDGTGTVTTDYTTALPYATIAGAANGLRTYNNTNYSRQNKAGSIIYLKTGSHAWTGGTVTADTVVAAAWVTITRYPGLAVSDVTIASQSGTKICGVRIKFLGVTLTAQSAAGVVTGATHVWADQCVINLPTSNQPFFYQNTVWYATRCTVTAFAQGFRPFSNVNAAPAIVRGNSGPIANTILAYTMIGNDLSVSSASLTDYIASMTVPSPVNGVVAFNRMKFPTITSAAVNFRNSFADTHGLAIVQNVFEALPITSIPCVSVAADGSIVTPVNNVLFWNNVVTGQRANLAYNEVDTGSGGGLAVRLGWSLRNNIWEDANIKSDTFAGSGYIADATKVGNWSVMYGCGCSGNLNVEATNIGAPGSFLFEFPGIRSDQPAGTGSPPACTTRPASYVAFVDRKSYDGTSAGAGGGDYHLTALSPVKNLVGVPVLPYDLAGAARPSSNDAAGAYAAPSSGGTSVAGRRLLMGVG